MELQHRGCHRLLGILHAVGCYSGLQVVCDERPDKEEERRSADYHRCACHNGDDDREDAQGVWDFVYDLCHHACEDRSKEEDEGTPLKRHRQLAEEHIC